MSQDIKLKDQTKESLPKMMIEELDKSIDSHSSTKQVSHDLIDIMGNPELSRTSFYIPPNPMNDGLLDKTNDEYYSFDSSTKRRVTNDTNVLLKIQGELLPLRCELSEIAAKFRALRLQRRIYGPIEESENASSGEYAFSSKDIDRRGSLQTEHRYDVGNMSTQFSPMTMVGKSMSRESFNHISTGNTKFFVETGLHGDRSYREPRQPMYFDITPSNKDSIIGREYNSERIANYYTQTSTSFERYHRPRSSCIIHDQYQSDKGNVVRSVNDDHSYYKKNIISRKSYDINGNQYTSQGNADQPADLLILDRSKEIVREDHRIRCDRRDGNRNFLGSSMSTDIVEPKLVAENSLSVAKESSSKISLNKRCRYSSLNVADPCPGKKSSISPTVKNVETFLRENTSKDYLATRELRLQLKHSHRKLHADNVIVNRSSQTSKHTIDFKDKSNVSSSASSRRIKVISPPNNIEKVKIVPVFFTTGIPKPLFPLIELDDDSVCSINRRDRSLKRALTLKEKNSLKISNNRTSGIIRRVPSENDVSCSYVTGLPLTLHRDYFSENERWHSGNNASSKMSISSKSRRSSSTKKTTSSNALKYSSALGSICSGIARVTVSGTAMSNQQKRFTQIREIAHEKGIRGMRSSPEDFLCDT